MSVHVPFAFAPSIFFTPCACRFPVASHAVHVVIMMVSVLSSFLQKKHLEADDRLIAETHYHLGVGHSLANQYSEAIAAFQASVDTILARVQRLQRQILDREQGK